jgi:DNA-binding NarL/FixJ family response regulator
MQIEEKIYRLSQLFRQKDDIEREIQELLGDAPKAKPVKEIRQPKTSRKSGTCKHLTAGDRIRIEEMSVKGITPKAIAEQLNVHVTTVRRIIAGNKSKSASSKSVKSAENKFAPGTRNPNKGHRFTTDEKKNIAKMFADGISAKVIAEQFGASITGIINYKNYTERPAKDVEKEYRCRDCGEVFFSKKSLIEVECPFDGSLHIDRASDR